MAVRRRLTWLVAFPLMVAGSLAAHALGEAAFELRTAGSADHDAVEVAGRVDHGSITGLPMIVGLVLAFALVGIGHLLYRRRRQRPLGHVSSAAFALLPPLAYALQEVAERVVRAEAFPFNPMHEPAFLLALALQVPFGIAAFCIGRVLLRLGRALARTFASTGLGWSGSPGPPQLLSSTRALPRRPILRAGPSQRAPPTLVVT